MSRDIFIKPNRGATGPNLYPEIAFSGTSSITPIKLKVDDDGSVLFTGTYGVLFNISDNKDGLLHSVNDVSGLPILSVYSYDYVQMGKWDKSTLVVNSDKVGVGLNAPSTKFHIYDTMPAFRLQDGTEGLGKVLTSDIDGVATWQSGGVIASGITNYISKFTNTSVLGDSQIFDNGTNIGIGTLSPTTKFHIYDTIPAFRLQDGTEGAGKILTSDVYGVATWKSGLTSSDNGLSEISTGIVGLGGSLVQNTIINGGLFDLSLGSNTSKLSNFYVNVEPNGGVGRIASGTSTFREVHVNVGHARLGSQDSIGGTVISVEDGIAYMFGLGVGGNQVKIQLTHKYPIQINDGSTDNYLTVQDDIASKGLVYIADYSANFTTYSLVTKGYVKSLISGAGTVNKYTSLNVTFVAGITQSFTHSLNSTSIITQTWDDTSGEIIYGKIFNRTLSSVDIVLSGSYSSVDVVIMS